MKTFKSIKDLEKYLAKEIPSILKNEVADEVVNIMTKDGGIIDKEVYEKYTPYNIKGTDYHYHRTYELKNPSNFSKEMVGDGAIEIRSTRGYKDRDIAEVIEYGKGYEWGILRDLDSEIGARPFHQKTKEELESSKGHVKAMKEGLTKRLGQGTVVDL